MVISTVKEIIELKKQKNAIILAHNYQIAEIQEIADFIGDSLELSRMASKVQCNVIVFCGVHFMAETAAILNPDKTVLLPEIEAGCPMADEMDIGELKKWIKKYPDAPVVSYVNTTAEVKALSYACCTSANAPEVVKAIPFDSLIFVPDKNLAHWVKKKVPEKNIIAWNGFCPIHNMAKKQDVILAKKTHPEAMVVVHPECPPEVLELADHVASTSGMIKFAKSSSAREFIIGTELGLLYRLQKENPDKVFHPLLKTMICPSMKITTLESVLVALKENKHIIRVPEDIRLKAREAVDRMLYLVS